ncbi:MAG: hypothetical protein OEY44_02050 [Candidatus Peregrinibacteria bacterium]|nr:hypothetical protein [Candidatus Peregrinibacteria bacterium]
MTMSSPELLHSSDLPIIHLDGEGNQLADVAQLKEALPGEFNIATFLPEISRRLKEITDSYAGRFGMSDRQKEVLEGFTGELMRSIQHLGDKANVGPLAPPVLHSRHDARQMVRLELGFVEPDEILSELTPVVGLIDDYIRSANLLSQAKVRTRENMEKLAKMEARNRQATQFVSKRLLESEGPDKHHWAWNKELEQKLQENSRNYEKGERWIEQNRRFRTAVDAFLDSLSSSGVPDYRLLESLRAPLDERLAFKGISDEFKGVLGRVRHEISYAAYFPEIEKRQKEAEGRRLKLEEEKRIERKRKRIFQALGVAMVIGAAVGGRHIMDGVKEQWAVDEAREKVKTYLRDRGQVNEADFGSLNRAESMQEVIIGASILVKDLDLDVNGDNTDEARVDVSFDMKNIAGLVFKGGARVDARVPDARVIPLGTQRVTFVRRDDFCDKEADSPHVNLYQGDQWSMEWPVPREEVDAHCRGMEKIIERADKMRLPRIVRQQAPFDVERSQEGGMVVHLPLPSTEIDQLNAQKSNIRGYLLQAGLMKRGDELNKRIDQETELKVLESTVLGYFHEEWFAVDDEDPEKVEFSATEKLAQLVEVIHGRQASYGLIHMIPGKQEIVVSSQSLTISEADLCKVGTKLGVHIKKYKEDAGSHSWLAPEVIQRLYCR